ncbi:MAG: sodium:solute symporter family transporter, partial [Gammaproteobacteria bacterium]
MKFTTLDIAIVVAYCIGIICIATWVSREKSNHKKTAEDYFLASRSLPWWAIGASLIAANISAEQIIAMSGDGYVIGLAIATYEWTAAIALIVMAKYFLPIFLREKIYTMPQFLEKRFDSRVKVVLALFWLAVYVFVNLTSILYLGATALNALAEIDMFHGMIFLALLSVAYSLYGGLKAVAYTDIIQVVLLVFGGLAVSYIALNEISGGTGVISGFVTLWSEIPDKFDMIFEEGHPFYDKLPGLSVLIGGLWIAHFGYWGFNQYITQRAFAAKSLDEAQKGIIFAAFLKLLMPAVVVLPGLAAAFLRPNIDNSASVYPTMMELLPAGLFGLTVAALIAAIVSSLSSMINSISTIFTMDIYRSFKRKDDINDYALVNIGRMTSLAALIIAVIVSRPLLESFDSAFQFIQEFTLFFTPGIVVIFLLALFSRKATTMSVLFAAIMSLVLSLFIWYFYPSIPFIDRAG